MQDGQFAKCASRFVEITSPLAYIDDHIASMLSPKKSLGQNFLRDENIARKIVASLEVSPDQTVVEIGPGQGDLTRILLQVSQRVVGVEVDTRAATILKERFSSGITVIEKDVLSLDLHEIDRQFGGPILIVGNIPYYITSDILFWLYDQRSLVQRALLMMQWEVAARLVANPDTKAYGILSVFTQLYATSELLFKVSRNSFHPRPGVDSAVVRFGFKPPDPHLNERLFRNVVRRTFGARRKTLRNGLKMMGFTEHQLSAVNFDFSKRPEQLAPSEFVALTTLLGPHSHSLSLKY
jgi:16S rRNA (adenine1518-N6/adenine1519-N6)-dimethyltransferase